MQDYTLDIDKLDKMLLDALLMIKEDDESLTLRRSCREGVCGSDGMNINGRNGLACITALADLKDPVEVRPLPGLPVIRDLVVDMTQFDRLLKISKRGDASQSIAAIDIHAIRATHSLAAGAAQGQRLIVFLNHE